MNSQEPKKTSILGNLGGIIGAGVSLAQGLGIGQAAQDRRQVKQQEKLNDVNWEDAKRRADYEQELAMKMWKDTNYTAQLAEADAAGVSRAAALGNSHGGTSGASVSSGANANAADAASSQNASINQMMAQAQIGMMIAQTKNINADTKNKEAGAENTIEDTGIKRVAAQVGRNTINSQISKIESEAQKALSEADIKIKENIISAETYEHQIKKIKLEAIGEGLENELKKAGIQKSYTEIKKALNDIKISNKGLEYQGTDKIMGKYVEKVGTLLGKILTGN